MNVLKMYLMQFFLFSTWPPKIQTEISKLSFFQNVIDLKICHNRDLGFVQPSEC